MRILILNDYATLTGGAEISLARLREALRARGHEVHWFTSSARTSAGPLMADSTTFGTTSSARTLLQVANPWAPAALRRVLAEFRPDVVHVTLFLTQLSPLILPVLRDVPSLFQAVWYRAVCPLGVKRLPSGEACHHPWGRACLAERCLPLHDWVPLMLQRNLLRRWRDAFGAVVAISEATRQQLEAGGWPVTTVMPNGTPVQPARPPLAGPPLVAFAARLVPEKGGLVILRAFAQVAAALPEARLLIIGDGAQRPALEAEAARLGLAAAVTFAGHMPPDQLERQLAGAWVQAMPSLFAEPFGMVAIEAMMRGTAVVASDHGGLSDVVCDGETGRLVPPGDATALAAALLPLLRSPALAERMGAAGRERALAEYTIDRQVDRLLPLYSALAALPRGAHLPALELA